VYGVVGLKTHAKTALVIRREDQLLRCYAHLGTGNYHRETSKLYTDFGLFTCQPDLTEDVVELFHFLTGRSLKRNYKKLLVAPIGMRETILKLIRREADFARAGRPARIIMKCNSLEEVSLCRALYEASEAGVEIDLIVRGFSCLRPGVRGLSSRIRLISIIGRFLEHSRVLFFLNGQSEPVKGDFYIGSADMMYRNLLARVETMAPIEDPTARTILWESFDIMLNDRRLAWEMQSDGTYAQYQPKTKEQETGTHERLMQVYKAHHRRWLEQEGEAGESDAGEEPKAT
jgi:polyphosphate kinase